MGGACGGTHHGHEDELAAEADDEGDGVLELALDAVGVRAAADAEADENGDGSGGAVEDEVGRALLPHRGDGELGGRHGLHDVGQLAVAGQRGGRVFVHHCHGHGHSADVKSLWSSIHTCVSASLQHLVHRSF